MRVEGEIKWYSYAKGYGFLKPSRRDMLGDVMLHATVIRKSGILMAPKPGDRMIVEAEENGTKGWQATRVVKFEAVAGRSQA